jgi:hypothetical protein
VKLERLPVPVVALMSSITALTVEAQEAERALIKR